MKDFTLKSAIKYFFNLSHGSAGKRTIHSLLNQKGFTASLHKISRLMKEMKLFSRQAKKKHDYPKSKGSLNLSCNNILARDFKPTAPNKSWVSDITYIPINKKWGYLSLVIDLFKRKAIGIAVSNKPDTTLVLDSLNMAYKLRKPDKNIIFHTDQGSQYKSFDVINYLTKFNFLQSMSRKGNCHDNAVIERAFRSLKQEWIPKEGYSTIEEARSSIMEYFLVYYNQIRPHHL